MSQKIEIAENRILNVYLISGIWRKFSKIYTLKICNTQVEYIFYTQFYSIISNIFKISKLVLTNLLVEENYNEEL